MSEKSLGPETKNAAYVAMQAKRDLPEALMGGTSAMRAKGTKYLRQWAGENGLDYDERLRNSVLDPQYKEAVEDLAGRVFCKSITLQDTVPPEIVTLSDNIDNAGSNLHVFLYERFKSAWAYGMECVLVDHTPTPASASTQGPSISETRQAGARSYWVPVAARDLVTVLGVIDGEPVVLEARIFSCTTKQEGEWGEKKVERCKIFYRGNKSLDGDAKYVRYKVLEKRAETAGGEPKWLPAIDAKGQAIQGLRKPHIDIPLVAIQTDNRAFFYAEPRLEDLAYQNVRLFQKESSLDSLLDQAAVPIHTATGVNDEEAKKFQNVGLGAGRLWTASSSDAVFGVLEMEGSVAKVLADDIEVTRGVCRRLAKEPLVSKPTGDVTATSDILQSAKASSVLDASAILLEDATAELLYMTALDLGLQEGGRIKVNRSFGFMEGQQGDKAELIDMAKNHLLALEVLYAELQRRGSIGDQWDAAALVEMLKQEKPLGMIGEDPAEEVRLLKERIAKLEGGEKEAPQ